jgi:hypothetical protein
MSKNPKKHYQVSFKKNRLSSLIDWPALLDPVAYVPKDVANTVKSLLDQSPEEVTTPFFWFLLTTVINITTGMCRLKFAFSFLSSKDLLIGKDTSTETKGIGLRALIQIVVGQSAHALTGNIQKINEGYVRNHLLISPVAPFFIWTINQAIHRQPQAALTGTWY